IVGHAGLLSLDLHRAAEGSLHMHESSPVVNSDAILEQERDDAAPAMPQLIRARSPQSHRIDTLLELVASLSRSSEPSEVLVNFARGIARLRGSFSYVSLSTRGLSDGEYRVTRMYTPE